MAGSRRLTFPFFDALEDSLLLSEHEDFVDLGVPDFAASPSAMSGNFQTETETDNHPLFWRSSPPNCVESFPVSPFVPLISDLHDSPLTQPRRASNQSLHFHSINFSWSLLPPQSPRPLAKTKISDPRLTSSLDHWSVVPDVDDKWAMGMPVITA